MLDYCMTFSIAQYSYMQPKLCRYTKRRIIKSIGMFVLRRMELGSFRKQPQNCFHCLNLLCTLRFFCSSITCILKFLFIFCEKKGSKKIKIYKQEKVTQSDRSALATVKAQRIQVADTSLFCVFCFV
jgi:hypothetical protein